MATIDDFGGSGQALNNPKLGGPDGWAAAVRDAIRLLQSGLPDIHLEIVQIGSDEEPTVSVTVVNDATTVVLGIPAGKSAYQVAVEVGFDGTESEWLASLAGPITGTADADQILFTQTGTGAVERTVESRLRESVSVLDFAAVGDGLADDTDAVQAALNAGRHVTIPAGRTFVVDAVDVPSDTYITGGGTLKHKDNTASFAILNVADASDVTIQGVRFDGNIDGQSIWSEFRHAVTVTGACAQIKVSGCTFTNLIGDGIYIGVPYLGTGTPSDIDIEGCSFLGDNTNRQGISVGSVDGLRIIRNHFEGMARDDMPGPIDIEPNNDDEPVDNVVIMGNTFIGGGTPVLQKAIAVNNNVGATVTNVRISDNAIRGKFLWGVAVFGDGTDKTKTQASVSGNVIALTAGPATAAGINAAMLCVVSISDNLVDGPTPAGIRIVGGTYSITGNTVRNATVYGIETLSTPTDTGTIVGNLIEDCGTNAIASAGGMHINGSHNIIAQNKVMSSAPTKSQCGLYIEAGVKNRIDGNTFLGMGSRAIICVSPQVFGLNTWNGNFNTVAGTYPPASETWVVGDVIYNPYPATPGGPVAWVCVTAGTPGTWVPIVAGVATATSAALTAIANVVNTANKYAGKRVWNSTTKKTVTAGGAAAGDVWYDETGATAHTPA